ncbi:hypothetical protein U1Q18_031979 [Sarracenia purpurea var. burkii]
MEEEEKNKGSIELDCDLLLSRRDDEPPPPILVVTPTIPAPERKRSPPTVGDDQQEQSQRRNVEEAINRQRPNFETVGLRLWDAGEKLRANRKRLEEEIATEIPLSGKGEPFYLSNEGVQPRIQCFLAELGRGDSNDGGGCRFDGVANIWCYYPLLCEPFVSQQKSANVLRASLAEAGSSLREYHKVEHLSN